MRLPTVLALLVSFVVFLACPAAARSEDSIDNLLSEFRGGPIWLTDKTFEQVVNGPRDQDVIVLLTAIGPQYGCQFCRVLQPEFEIVANSWHKAHPKGDGLIFAIADLSKTQGIYKALQLTHAPNVWVYKKTDKEHHYSQGYDIYKFPQVPQQVDPLVSYIKHTLGHSVKIEKPFPWGQVISTVTIVVGIVVALKVFFWQILAIFQSRRLWVAVSMVAVLLFTSGHMFNAIRKTPYVAGDGHGGVSYFVGGHSNQVAIETQIVAIVYAILAFSTIMLITKVPTIKDAQKQLLLVVVLSAVIFVAYSFLISKFHIKNGGYPFWMLKL